MFYQKKNIQYDLGVIINNKLSWDDQCMAAVAKTKRMFYHLLKHVFSNPDPELVTKLYNSYIRVNLEFAISVWRPHFIKDKTLSEKLQRKVRR